MPAQNVPAPVASSSASKPAQAAQTVEFSDDPSFAVAGVTDWTAVGGHGSDATLRTSEDLARATLSLSADKNASSRGVDSQAEAALRAALAAAPASYSASRDLGEYYLSTGKYQEALPLLKAAAAMHHQQAEDLYSVASACRGVGDLQQAKLDVQQSLAQKETAAADRLAGEVDEQLGDPLSAVRYEERAADLDPSEENYFAWGSELLLHRAVWQASRVFRLGSAKYPTSARMLTGWGAALFGSALYEEASQRLCAASDLDPQDAETYLLMGKVELAAPTALPCIESRLAGYLRARPEDAAANYLYAMCLEKQDGSLHEAQVKGLLLKAVSRKQDFAEAYLQLGVLSSNRRDYAQAIAYYTRALQADPMLGEAHYRLGMAYDRSGNPSGAKKEFAAHEVIEKEQADAVERQRRQIKQFSVASQGPPAHANP